MGRRSWRDEWLVPPCPRCGAGVESRETETGMIVQKCCVCGFAGCWDRVERDWAGIVCPSGSIPIIDWKPLEGADR